MYVCICAYVSVLKTFCVSIGSYVYVCMYTLMSVCMYVCMYVCMEPLWPWERASMA